MKGKRIYSLLVITIVACFLMVSCSAQIDSPSEGVTEEKSASNLHQEDATITVSDKRFRTNYFSSNSLSLVLGAVTGDTTFLWGCNFLNDIVSYTLVQYNWGEDCNEYPLSVSKQGSVVSVDVVSDKIYYLERIDTTEETTSWSLHSPGNTILLNWATTDNALSHIAIVGDTLWIADRNQLHICHLSDGQIIKTIGFEENISKFLKTHNQETLVYAENNGAFFSISNEGELLSQIATLPQCFIGRPVVSGLNSGYDCLIIGETELYGWNIGTEGIVQFLSFDTYGLVANNLSAFVCLGNDVFLGATWRSGDPVDRLFWLSPDTDSTDVGTEKTLRIAGLSRPMVLASAISDFKALCPEYTVEYIDYAELYGDQAQQRLQIDLIQGTAPDLLFVNGLPFETYVKRGMLENLYQWIDEDNTLQRDHFTSNLMAATESYDGNLYKIPQSYSIVTTAANEIAGNLDDNWSYDDINEIMMSNPDLRSAFYGETKESLSVTLSMYMIDVLVDYENARSKFDSPEAISFLGFLNNIVPHDQLHYIAENEMDALRNGEILFAQLMILSPQQFADIDDTGGKLVYPGYPYTDGGNFYLNLPMAIPVNATEKEGAWEFLKMLITSEYYSTRGGWLPIQSSFENSLEEAIVNGCKEITMRKLAEIQGKICDEVYYDEVVSNIILDETGYLFNDVKTAEETATLIHSRVQLYLSEQDN